MEREREKERGWRDGEGVDDREKNSVRVDVRDRKLKNRERRLSRLRT